MTRMISIARIDPSKKREDWIAEHDAKFGQYATIAGAFAHPEDKNQIAVVMNVTDLDGLRAASRSADGDTFMRERGFIEQLDYFLEA
ncbi:hypothetical protein [Boseongicola aestuarii]|jgi:hypothetical protein|uniref:YCII-related domain-containing protein n=1 Tax=Boseongicola aestuarii TaxID=1470561 RepID=A0A238J0S4_9RHOB|nr:hypothetical protein [Boseongicola aestuarii]SMX23775.1 hypothetical protein BOA8489_01887 [Boseongicola aestuarii]